jgi:hypothetical protein
MANAATTDPPVGAQDYPAVATPPYAPSWFDHFTAGVSGLPGPWSPEVPQLLITAFLLPVVLFVITQFLGRLLSP